MLPQRLISIVSAMPYEPVAKVSTAVSRVTLHIDTARKCAVAPAGGQISVILRASDCRFGGSREPSDFCNRLLCTVRLREVRVPHSVLSFARMQGLSWTGALLPDLQA